MIYKEANYMIDDITWSYGGKSITKDDIIECRETCHKALEKQIPNKAISTYKGHYKCPTCENYIDITDDDLYVYEIEPPKYCDECGQALDWGSEEE